MAGQRKKAALAGAAALALAAGGVGVAQAVGGGDDDEPATGPDADRAKAAGVQGAGGGRAIEAERSDDSGAAWEVKVEKADGTLIEVQLNERFEKLSAEVDDDSPGQDGGADDEGDDR